MQNLVLTVLTNHNTSNIENWDGIFLIHILLAEITMVILDDTVVCISITDMKNK